MLSLSRDKKDKMIKHSLREFPNEACGILAGRVSAKKDYTENRVEKVYSMTNTDKSAATFFMEPKEQLKVMKEIRNLGLEMIGIYHSHPETWAYPSAHDVKLAFYPEVSYIIVSLKDKNKPEIKAFKIIEGKIEEEPIIFN